MLWKPLLAPPRPLLYNAHMRKILLVLISSFLIAQACFAFGGMPPQSQEGAQMPSSNNPQVVLETSKGKIVIELYPDKAPITVKNFLGYVDSGFYDGTIFHRVIPGFMIQGGGFTQGMTEKPAGAPIKNEAGNGLSNQRGTVAMARTSDVDSATAQFFVNVVDNVFLDHRDDTPVGFGYCVFGRVVDGMDAVDVIANVPTHTVGFYENVPAEDIIIESVKRK